jgi:hypothetical protein
VLTLFFYDSNRLNDLYLFTVCHSVHGPSCAELSPSYWLFQAELLRDIWLDYRQEMQLQPPKPRLPEPPAQRELLKAEIKFFIDSIHEKAKAHGR